MTVARCKHGIEKTRSVGFRTSGVCVKYNMRTWRVINTCTMQKLLLNTIYRSLIHSTPTYIHANKQQQQNLTSILNRFDVKE